MWGDLKDVFQMIHTLFRTKMLRWWTTSIGKMGLFIGKLFLPDLFMIGNWRAYSLSLLSCIPTKLIGMWKIGCSGFQLLQIITNKAVLPNLGKAFRRRKLLLE